MNLAQNYSVVLISGKQGSGKTTLADGLQKEFADRFTVYRMKFAGPLYNMHDAIRGLLAKDLMDDLQGIDGPLLQVLGTEWARKTRGEDFWVRYAKRKVVAEMLFRVEVGLARQHCLFVFDDCRFPNELEAFGSRGITLRLEAPEEVRKTRAEKWRENTMHLSETSLDEAKFNIVFDTAKHDKFYVMNSARAYVDLRATSQTIRESDPVS